jgi:iron-sulfur cluster repair protein YtfE (RIC family)
VNFKLLIEEHDRIVIMAVEFERLVALAEPDMESLIALRARLSSEVVRHLAHEDAFIYPEMIEHGSERIARTARQFVEEFEDLRNDWVLFLEEWSTECIIGDWIGFREETHAIMRRLRFRVQQENEILYPMALQTGAIRLRA